jgi:hypothetical protein
MRDAKAAPSTEEKGTAPGDDRLEETRRRRYRTERGPTPRPALPWRASDAVSPFALGESIPEQRKGRR